MPRRLLCALAVALASACDSGGGGDDFWDQDGGTDADADTDVDSDTDTDSDQPAYADTVVEAPGATGEGLGDPQNAVNGVRGCGLDCSSQDVFALGYAADEDNYVTLRWSEREVLNGPGADLAVFENPFVVGDGPERFMDQAVIFLSRDGETWVALPHDYTAADETVYEPLPELWSGFGGVTPVLLHEEDNPVDPADPELAGGDHFDLDDLPEGDPEADAIREQGFTFIKLVAAPSLTNADTGEPFVKEEISNGADIDGVYAFYFNPS